MELSWKGILLNKLPLLAPINATLVNYDWIEQLY